MSLLLLFNGGRYVPPPPPSYTRPAIIGQRDAFLLLGRADAAPRLVGQQDAFRLPGVNTMPMTINFSMALGDTEVIPLSHTNSDGTAFNLSGCSIAFGVTKQYDSTVVFTKTTAAGGIVITNAAAGLATLTISPADTTGLAPGLYSYDVLVTTASGAKSTMTIGTITLLAHPSR